MDHLFPSLVSFCSPKKWIALSGYTDNWFLTVWGIEDLPFCSVSSNFIALCSRPVGCSRCTDVPKRDHGQQAGGVRLVLLLLSFGFRVYPMFQLHRHCPGPVLWASVTPVHLFRPVFLA